MGWCSRLPSTASRCCCSPSARCPRARASSERSELRTPTDERSETPGAATVSAPEPFLVDSHCHLQNLDGGEREAALDRARERGVRGFLLPAVRLEDADEVLALCDAHDDVWCALG